MASEVGYTGEKYPPPGGLRGGGAGPGDISGPPGSPVGRPWPQGRAGHAHFEIFKKAGLQYTFAVFLCMLEC